MRLIVESETDAGKDSDLQDRMDEALELLREAFAPEEQDPVLALAEQLRESTPPFFLAALPPRAMADRVADCYRFLAGRDEEVAVSFLPLPDNRFLLLTNTPDAPYLVHSVQTCLIRRKVRFQVVSHPILAVRRKRGRPVAIAGPGGEGKPESLILLRLEANPDFRPEALEKALRKVLGAVLRVHADQRELGRRLREREQATEDSRQRDFLHWLLDGNFIPFSYRCLEVRPAAGGSRKGWTLAEREGSVLGLRPDPRELDCCRARPLDDFAPELRERLLRERPVVIETIERPSPILRNENLVYLGIREGEADGGWQEHTFLGLFTERSKNELSRNVPALRKRIEGALERLAVPRDCHDWRKTLEILNTFPKVELFFMTPEELEQTIHSFTHLYRYGSVKVVAARNLAVHGITLLLIMPRDFYSSDNLARIEAYLRRALKSGPVDSRVIHISSDYLSLQVSARPETEVLRLDLPRLERGLTRIVKPWKQRLRHLLIRDSGEAEGRARWERFAGAFGREYRTLVHPRFALRDLRCLERLLDREDDQVDLWGPFPGGDGDYFRLQFYSLRKTYLNDLMPILENLNLCVIDEVDFDLEVDGRETYIKSFSIRGGPEESLSLSAIREVLLEAFRAVLKGEAENDYLNRLLVLTGLDWRQLDIFRGYRNYYFQLGSPFTKRRVAFALIHNHRAARLLYDYFDARFRTDPRWDDPATREEEGLFPIRQQLAAAFEEVADINEDRILRALFNLIDSTVRTNFFLRRDREDYFFAFKISALGIIDMPAPRPLFEIYVHAATMEGIHLRGGKVARGGIRWSDRPDDFRTEILGLMKTQMTKNTLIVPVGSKGGFVVKTPFATREEGAALSRAAYQVLMRGLLDLTDNRDGERIVPPAGVVAYDEPDPYLVVAADKGTAQFSDVANAISREYGFWLDDAFASGGSHGYDHKKLGITARGAWECVKRHFRELGIDIQSEPFTVVGIGDMSGDVFGNGMLLSPCIRLRGAFDHRHIFLDPDPDPAATYRERQRLFDLPRSSWADYDARLISEGGGVFPRDAKEIPLSKPVRKWLGVRQESVDGPGLVRLLLRAEVDLLWNGGIGTYVKSSGEKHEDAGDRANDAVRVDASELRARVVGEGGNLGLTQRARIEYALAGGRINTDAVDNSGGVDCSDHEVNLKIFMQTLMNEGRIDSMAERNRQLEAVTDGVVAAVLANNDSQSLCLSLDRRRCGEDAEPFFDLSDRLVRAGLLDRKGEFLPAAKEVLAREEAVLVRPELAILMAYGKMQLYDALLDSRLPEKELLGDRLHGYFPAAIRERYGNRLEGHPLAREITATVLTNEIVDQAGAAFLNRLVRKTGAPLARAAEAYLVFDRVLDGAGLRQALRDLDNRLAADDQYRLLLELETMIGVLCEWALERGLEAEATATVVERYRDQAEDYRRHLGGLLPAAEWQACKEREAALVEQGVPEAAAHALATLAHFRDFLPLAELVGRTDGDFYSVARTYREVQDHLGLEALLDGMLRVPVRDRWDRMALQALEGAFTVGAFRLTAAVFTETDGNPDSFLARHRLQARAFQRLRDELRGAAPTNLHPFTVLARALESLAGAAE